MIISKTRCVEEIGQNHGYVVDKHV